VLSPLKKYIDSFVVNVNNSMEVSTAFSVLKKQVDINEFSQLISLFQICYQNGGEFINVLEKYIKFLLNKISNKEKEKQDANSSILILIIMVIMSIFILLFYIIKNNENKTLMLSTGIGNAILLINIFSYIYCFWAIFKIYRME
jgi:Flp pilus assembly protein TadB